MNMYEKNLNFFRSNLQAVYNCLINEMSRYDSKIEIVSEKLNLKVELDGKKCFLHSVYDTKRENEKVFSLVDKEVEKLVIFGFGLGNSISYVCDNFKNLRNITVIEPDLNIFKTMLNYVDIEDAVKKVNNITFIINKTKEEACEILWEYMKDNLTEKVGFVYNLSYRSLFTEYYEYINSTISSNVKNYMMNIATEDLYIYKWTENIIKNSKQLADDVQNFSGEFDDMPVILVSAGPSLNYSLEYLNQVKDKAVILALGSAIKILDSNNIVPHFRIAFDGSEAERSVFNGIDTESCSLIFSDMLNYNILKEYKGKKYRMVLDTDHISRYIQSKISSNKHFYECGFSVVNVALDVVIKLGFKKIIFIGQDLCYTEGNVHAKGTWRKDDNEVKFDSERFIKTTNILGETVYTDKPFLGMKHYMEDKIEKNLGITYINATQKGLNIKGTINKTFIQVMQEDLTDLFNVEYIVSEVNSKNFMEYSSNLDKLEKLDSVLIEELKHLVSLNDDRLKRLKKLNKYCEKGLGINKLQVELKYIQQIENDLENIEFYRKAVKPMIFNKFKAIYMNYAYNGKDEKILIERNVKALLGQTVELNNYLKFILSLIEQKK